MACRFTDSELRAEIDRLRFELEMASQASVERRQELDEDLQTVLDVAKGRGLAVEG